MPNPSRATTGPRLSRRTALAALAAAAGGGLAACTAGGEGPSRRQAAPSTAQPQLDPDVVVAADALEAQSAVLELVRATAERHPRLRGPLAPVLAAHEAHVALLADAAPEAPVGSAAATASGSPSPAASDGPFPEARGDRRTPVPREPARALQRLVAAEQELATTTKRHAFRAQSGAFARVLGSMAAAAAQHAVVLGTGPAGGAA